MQVISKSKNYDGTIMSFMEGGVARNSCIMRLAYRLWQTMPGTHDAHSLLKPQQLIYMHRGGEEQEHRGWEEGASWTEVAMHHYYSTSREQCWWRRRGL